ncbi:MAG: thiopurine S-methyltransferase [Pseudomonadota bacterium]
MDAEYWHRKWRDNQIAFHEPQANGLLREHLDRLGLEPGARVFLPLCGKTRDIGHLCGLGFRVVGAELSEAAVTQLFSDLDLVPEIQPFDSLRLYSAGPVSVFVGDVFALDREVLGPVAAVYDRAALVALPPDMCARYVEHVAAMTADAPQVVISLEYDQSTMAGPPFSVPEAEIRTLYGGRFSVTLLEARPISGALAARCSGSEVAWLLTPGPVAPSAAAPEKDAPR